MHLKKASNGHELVLSRKEWEDIGKKAGWNEGLELPSSPEGSESLSEEQRKDAWHAGFDATSYFRGRGRTSADIGEIFLWAMHNDGRVPDMSTNDPQYGEWREAVNEGMQAFKAGV